MEAKEDIFPDFATTTDAFPVLATTTLADLKTLSLRGEHDNARRSNPVVIKINLHINLSIQNSFYLPMLLTSPRPLLD
ncbi:hypothetical protein KKE68_07970 [Patescibacteria group bacterium]|nr:hypothetical protein [Patescibacteria group bacterium]